MAVADAITSFIAVRQRDWTRRTRNQMIPYAMRQIDEARAEGNKPDVKQIIEDAFARSQVPMPELS